MLPQILVEALTVGAGGALGCMARYGLQNSSLIPVGFGRFVCTVVVNIVGSFLIGVLWAVFNATGSSKVCNLFAVTGFLGGFTTYSAFALDTVKLIREGLWLKSSVCVGATLVGGVLACILGLYIAERILKWLG